MAYYLIANYDVKDQEMLEQYKAAAGPTMMKYGAKVLVADNEPNDIEGKSRQGLIILEFESEEAAMRWYNSPEYQAVVNLRIQAIEGWLRGAPQLVMPAS